MVDFFLQDFVEEEEAIDDKIIEEEKEEMANEEGEDEVNGDELMVEGEEMDHLGISTQDQDSLTQVQKHTV